MFKDMEIDEELGKELDKRERTMHVKTEVMKKIEKYNQWVDEVREKTEQWRPKKPEFGTKVPFAKSNIYYMKSEKDYEKYPELLQMEKEADKATELDECFGKYYKPK